MNILVIVLAAAASLYTAFAFYKAGKFKAFSTKETLLGAGFGWVETTPFWTVRLIAWLELLGAAGLVIAPIGYFLGFTWAIWFAVAAAAGLALTMVGAIILHAKRGEGKYTFKMNMKLLVVSLLAVGLWAYLPMV
jgi:type III secretory pathway component EscT